MKLKGVFVKDHQLVLKNYEIYKNTIALVPARQIEYDTIVLERGVEYYVRKTPLELIKEACIEGGSTYDGRREAVTY